MTKNLTFRPWAGLVGVFAILTVIGSSFPRPSLAQTSLACTTAVGALEGTKYAGKPLRLLETFSDREAVNEFLATNSRRPHVGGADTIQLFSMGPGHYMVMASIQGCHVAHYFTDDPEVMKS